MTDRKRRIKNFAVAGGLALVAALLTMLYVGRAKGAGPSTQDLKSAPVLVATSDLAVGASADQAISDGTLVVRQVPVAAVQPDTLSSDASLRGDVVLQPIYAGEQVTSRRFGPSGTEGASSGLSGGMRIMSVPGDANQLLDGTLHAGDHVDVVASLKAGEQQTAYTKVILHDILVLDAPAASVSASTSGDESALAATVELTDAQAQTLYFAMENGNWSFVLRPVSNAVTTILPSTSVSTLLGAAS
jgi:pilus assembly protein CpaB